MNKQKYFVLLILMILSISVYLNSIYGQFLLDDEMLIQDSMVIRSFSMNLFTYRLVRTFTYAIDYFFWGLNPMGYHLSNLFYNSLTVLVVFLLTRRLTGIFSVAVFTAVLFAVHPIHTDVVSYLSGRRDILSCLFYLLGFFFYVKARQERSRWIYFLVLISYLAGVLSKEMAITLPLIIFVYEIILWIESHKEKGSSIYSLLAHAIIDTAKKFRWAILSVFVFVLSYLYMVLFIQGASWLVQQERFFWWGGTATSNFATVFRIVLTYLYKLFFPIILHVDYHEFPYSRSFLDPRFIIAGFVVMGLIGFSLKILKQNWVMAFSIWWFFLTLLPVMQIIPHHIIMAEHYLYLPSYGFCLFLSLVFYNILQRKNLKIPLMLCAVVLVALFSIRTVDRNQDWQDTVTLMKDGLEHNATNPLYHFFLGRTYALNKLIRSADQELALSIGPRYDYADNHAVMALVEFQQGEYEEGVHETEEALIRESDNQMALTNRGYFAVEVGDYETALKYYSQVKPDYDSGNALVKIAFVHMKLGDLEKAEASLLKLLTIFPKSGAAYLGLADVYTRAFRFDEAIDQYHYVLKRFPMINFTQIVAKAGVDIDRIRESLRYVEDLKKRHDVAVAALRRGEAEKGHLLLGEIYMTIGSYERAEEELEKAMLTTEDTAPIELLLGQVYMESGKDQQAENLFHRLTAPGSDPSVDVLAGAGEFYARTLRFRRANKLYERVLQKDPGNRKIKFLLNGSIRLEELLRQSEELQKSGHSVEAALTRSNVYVAVEKNQEAIEILEKLLESEPDDLRLLMTLGALYEKMEYPYRSKTLQTYRHLLFLDGNNPETYNRLGQYYYTVIEDYESALDCFQRSLVLDPKQNRAESIKSTIDKLHEYVRLYLGDN